MFSAPRVHFAWICVYLSAAIPSERATLHQDYRYWPQLAISLSVAGPGAPSASISGRSSASALGAVPLQAQALTHVPDLSWSEYERELDRIARGHRLTGP
jgi:hypothetical protein